MLKNVLFFINILKIVVSARRSINIHQTSAFVILLCWNLLSNFCWWGARFGFVSRRRVSLLVATLLILNYWFLKGMQLYRQTFVNQALPAVYQKKMKESRNCFPQRQQMSLSAFFSHHMLNAKERIYEYPLVIYR